MDHWSLFSHQASRSNHVNQSPWSQVDEPKRLGTAALHFTESGGLMYWLCAGDLSGAAATLLCARLKSRSVWLGFTLCLIRLFLEYWLTCGTKCIFLLSASALSLRSSHCSDIWRIQFPQINMDSVVPWHSDVSLSCMYETFPHTHH